MGQHSDSISPGLSAWITKQRIFFVATAPISAGGHINCSPKGGDTFRVIGEREVAYLDLTGSGIETVAHLGENRRIVIMFCAFEGPPRIVRLHGSGSAVYPDDVAFAELRPRFGDFPGIRSIIRVSLERVSDSCGYAVPQFDFVRDRDALDRWAEDKGPDGLARYRAEKNAASIDGLPGYRDPCPEPRS